MQQILNVQAGYRRRASTGFTLLEVAVTLVVMAIVASVILPVLPNPRATPSAPPLDRVVREASDLAVRRAEWLTLRARADGRWDLRSDLSSDTMSLAAGTVLRDDPAPLTVRLSPLGACLTSDVTSAIDPCAAIRPGEPRR